jgi:ribosomal protein S18 acetylase RimI-like enzyme
LNHPSVRRATAADRPATVAVLTDAFSVDPVVRWFFADDATYPARAEIFFGSLFDVRVAAEGAWVTGRTESVALWSPPARGASEWEDRVWDAVLDTFTPGELDRCNRWDAAVAPHHPPTPHSYLGVLGTASVHQGRGLGPAVARPGLDAAAADGRPAFLETGVEANVSLYERLGFVVTGVIDDPGLPAGWCMRRDPPSDG